MHIQLARHSFVYTADFWQIVPTNTIALAFAQMCCWYSRCRVWGVYMYACSLFRCTSHIENSKAQSNRWLCECNLMNICVKRSLDYNNYHKKRKCFGEQLANVRARNKWRIKILFINNFSGDSHVGYFTSQLNWLYFRKCEWGSLYLSIFLSFNSRAQLKPVMYLCIP